MPKKKNGGTATPPATGTAKEPKADRPYVPGYGIPTTTKGLLPWSFAEERLTQAKNYWVCTVGPGGKPHAVPVWGAWVDGAVFCGGSEEVLWARNLAANPMLTVHLESGDEVVILEGLVDRIKDPKHPLVSRVSGAYHSKYKLRHPPPFWSLRARAAFAWTTKSRFQDATRWRWAERAPGRAGVLHQPHAVGHAEPATKNVDEPKADRPYVPGYGIPTTMKGLLPWKFAEERLGRAMNYWICTAGPDGGPHVRPVWGLWVDEAVCFGGHGVRWEKNLAANPLVSVHLESGDEVVILEGTAERVTDETHPLVALCAAASKKKYGMGGGVPFWALRPRTAFAWTLKSMFKDATRWRFD